MATDSPDQQPPRPAEQTAGQRTPAQQPAAAQSGSNPPQAINAPGGPNTPQTTILQQAELPRVDTAARLGKLLRRTVAFPPCADELLALARVTDPNDDVTRFFDEYFEFRRHQTLGEYTTRNPDGAPVPRQLADDLPSVLDRSLLFCRESDQPGAPAPEQRRGRWPSDCCFCTPCVTLDGNRNSSPTTTDPQLKRLFIGDLVWLFYFERMSIFQILGAILDTYASNGRFPISNGSIDAGFVRDDVVALVLEAMVRQTKTGLSSTVRDRGCTYRTCLGWVSDAGRKLNLDTEVNTGFNVQFHKFIYTALEFYKDRRLAVAIQGAAAPAAQPSVATLISIRDTIDVLKKRFEMFDYGRNYNNALSGIVWVIGGMAIVRELRTTLGIPPAYSSTHEFIPAAYDLLVLKRPISYSEMNRFDLNRTCAENGRDLLLDLEVINHNDTSPRGELENWLVQVEGKVEAYRTAYRALTGVDLGTSATAAVSQAV